MTAFVCGVDEAGRGPLVGAVFAAAVILDSKHPVIGLADSKKLSEKKRDVLAAEIKAHARAWCIAQASVEEIDAINILQASLLAMKRAVEGLGMAPSEVLVDGNFCPDIMFPAQAIVKGDSKVAEISAASILAKTARDADMLRLHAIYPEYGFNRHKGYPVPEHLAALSIYGITSEHRRSYAPVKKFLL